MIRFSVVLVVSVLLMFSCKNPDKRRGDAEEGAYEKLVFQPSQRPINPMSIVVPDGYAIEAYLKGLSYPVDVTFDDKGNIYVAEAGGHTYGTKPGRAPEARILRILPDMTVEVLYDKVVPMPEIKENSSSDKMAEGLIPPLTGITWHEGKLYVSHRSRYSTFDPETGEFKTIINGLPSWGEFLNAKPIFRNEKMYFFLSTQGNSGVIEEHWAEVISEFNKPEAREIPGEDITLTGKNFWVPTAKIPLTDADSVRTGAYSALGDTTVNGQLIKGELICNGAFYQCNPDGSNIVRLAWGLRSSFGYRFGPKGRIITTMNSANPMPPRGLYFDYETIYEVIEGEWYGWPDFFSGIPITDERFRMKDDERDFVLTADTHRKLLKGKELPVQPLVKLPPHSATQGMVFGNGTMNVPATDILVAEFGSIVPEFKGEDVHPHRPEGFPSEENAPEGSEFNWPGFKVQQVNLSSGEITDFVYNISGVPSSADNSGGLERPLQLEWDPQGNLFIVDFGVVEFDDTGMNAHPHTGVLWKLKKK